MMTLSQDRVKLELSVQIMGSNILGVLQDCRKSWAFFTGRLHLGIARLKIRLAGDSGCKRVYQAGIDSGVLSFLD